MPVAHCLESFMSRPEFTCFRGWNILAVAWYPLIRKGWVYSSKLWGLQSLWRQRTLSVFHMFHIFHSFHASRVAVFQDCDVPGLPGTQFSCLSGFACFKELMGAVSRSKWCAVSTSRSSASSKTTSQRFTKSRFAVTHSGKFWSLRVEFELLLCLFSSCQLLAFISSLCWVWNVFFLMEIHVKWGSVLTRSADRGWRSYPAWLYKSWRMLAGKLR